MINRKFFGKLSIVIIPFILVACGTIATPVPDQVDILEEAHEDTASEAEIKVTNTAIPPTEVPATEVPPTEVPPTEVPPTEIPPTEVPATEVAVSSTGDPVLGEALFNEFQPAASFACVTCHLVDSEAMLIGPGLFNVAQRAETRVAGQSAEEYLHAAIIAPDDYIVEGYPPMLMPQNFGEIFSEEDINNIIAYLYTLGDAPVTQESSSDTSGDSSSSDATSSGEAAADDLAVIIAESGDPINGQALFNEFQAEVAFACSTCHLVDMDVMLIGPGLLNVAQQAETRVDGQSAAQYLYDSIIMPNSYIVEGFTPDLMPQTFSEVFSEQEIYDLLAYLYTLE